jgi:hypothetical protein
MSLQAVLRKQSSSQFRHRYIAFSLNPPDQNIYMCRQRAATWRTPLPRRRDRTSPRLALRKPNCRSWTHAKSASRRTARLAALNAPHNPNT